MLGLPEISIIDRMSVLCSRIVRRKYILDCSSLYCSQVGSLSSCRRSVDIFELVLLFKWHD